MFCATSALCISWQHLNHSNLLVCAVYRFDVYFHARLILHNYAFLYHMKMDLARLKTMMRGVHVTVSVMYGEWFYTIDYGIFGHEVKATERSPPDNLT